MTTNRPSAFRLSTYVGMLVVALLMFVAGCEGAPPKQIDNACQILKEKPRWKKHVLRTVKRRKVNAAVLLAIMKQESSFHADAKPPRERILWLIPWKRSSSAFGYAQAIDGTWEQYKEKGGRRFVDRNNFDDAIDFIGWYVAQTHKQLGISKRDAYRNYLAYHEGWKGYRQGTYKIKNG